MTMVPCLAAAVCRAARSPRRAARFCSHPDVGTGVDQPTPTGRFLLPVRIPRAPAACRCARVIATSTSQRTCPTGIGSIRSARLTNLVAGTFLLKRRNTPVQTQSTTVRTGAARPATGPGSDWCRIPSTCPADSAPDDRTPLLAAPVRPPTTPHPSDHVAQPRRPPTRTTPKPQIRSLPKRTLG